MGADIVAKTLGMHLSNDNSGIVSVGDNNDNADDNDNDNDDIDEGVRVPMMTIATNNTNMLDVDNENETEVIKEVNTEDIDLNGCFDYNHSYNQDQVLDIKNYQLVHVQLQINLIWTVRTMILLLMLILV